MTDSSAGHPPPAVRRDGRTILWPQDGSHGIGGPQGFSASTSSIVLHSGDAVLLYTNGVLDVSAPGGQTFGESRLLGRLNRSPDQTAKEMISDILKGLQQHMQHQPQPDDIAMLAIRRC